MKGLDSWITRERDDRDDAPAPWNEEPRDDTADYLEWLADQGAYERRRRASQRDEDEETTCPF